MVTRPAGCRLSTHCPSKSLDCLEGVRHQPCVVDDLVNIIKEFVNELPYWDELNVPRKDPDFELSILEELQVMAILGDWNVEPCYMQEVAGLSAGIADFFYPLNGLGVNRICAFYTWFLIYVDDMAPLNSEPFLEFQQRFFKGFPQLDPVLDALAGILIALYELWDTAYANFMITATCESITATCVEHTIKVFTPAHPSSRFPWFLRARTSISMVYGMMMFPKSSPLDFKAFFRAVPDMEFWIAGVNDLMSFYKEYQKGEEGTYVYHRAHMQGISPIEVLSTMKTEISTANSIVTDVLHTFGGSTAVKTWKHMAFGYVLWHLEYPRYKLKDLDLGPT